MTQTLENNDYWAPEKYNNPGTDPMIDGSSAFIGTLMGRLIDYYLAAPEQAGEIYASPIKSDLGGLPKTLLLTMEYDYLREEGEACAAKMKEAGTAALPVSLRFSAVHCHGLSTAPVPAAWCG